MFTGENIMRILLTTVFCLFIVVHFSGVQTQGNVEGQQQTQGVNRFEGYNIFLDAMTEQAPGTPSCASRYVKPSTQITISDLNPATPMKLGSCGDGKPSVQQTGANSARVIASEADYKWCFTGEDRMYRITFQGDRYSGQITYNWIATPAADNLGFYNIRDFGAKGDGNTDDTIAIQSAMAFVASRGRGGVVRFPEGEYPVGNVPNFKGITLAPGVTIEGVGSLHTDAAINLVVKRSPTRITLKGANRALFRIGECTDRVVLRDIELFAENQTNTYGVEAVGAYLSSQDFFFDRVVFNQFYRGIYAHMLNSPNTFWQFDYIKINGCKFVYNRDAAIWVDLWNTDWKVEGSMILAPLKSATQKADGIFIARAGFFMVQDTFAGVPGGNTQGQKGGDFLNIVESANLTVIGSQSEGMTRSLVFGEVAGAGNLSYPITLLNNIMGEPVEIKARRMLVSTGNLYGANSVRLAPDVEVYSTGDRFCYDGFILGCQQASASNANAKFNGGKIIFQTGQLANGSVPGRPTVIGTEIQMPIFNSRSLPRTSNNGTMLFCEDCRRNSPCSGGGTGAPAMFINNRWECL
jgi:hypothetical protein